MKTLMMMLTMLLISLLAVGAFAQSAGPVGVTGGDEVNGGNEEATQDIDNRSETDGTQEQWGPPTQGGLIPVSSEIEIEFVDMDGDGFIDYEIRNNQDGKRQGTTTETRPDNEDKWSKQRGAADDGAADEKVFGDSSPDTGTQTGDSWNEQRTHGPGFESDEPIGPLENEGEETFGEENDRGSRSQTGRK